MAQPRRQAHEPQKHEFNCVRTDFFEGIGMDVLPASTGVGAANGFGTALAAKVIAVCPKTPEVWVQKTVSPLQGEAFSYSSAFSRAMELCDAASRTLYPSGTASIAPDGRTLHAGDAANQIEATMETVEAILDQGDMRLEDVTRGIVYLKHGCDVLHWNHYCQRRGLGHLPVVVTQAEVCREYLLFGIELDAAKQCVGHFHLRA